MKVKQGDQVRMTDLTTGLIHDVTVVEVHLNGKVIVQADRDKGPARQWLTGTGFLSPREAAS